MRAARCLVLLALGVLACRSAEHNASASLRDAAPAQDAAPEQDAAPAPDATAAPVPEPAPEHLASAERSLAAKPGWVKKGGYAPPAPLVTLQLFFVLAETKSAPMDLDGDAFVVCRGLLGGGTATWLGFEIAKRSDVVVGLRLGKLLATEGLHVVNDDGEVLAGFPLARLAKGDSITVTLADRAMWIVKEQRGAITLPFQGSMPISAEKPGIRAECRAAPRRHVEKALVEPLAEVDKTLNRIRGADAVSAQLADFGLYGAGFGKVRDALEQAAALVGWADPRVALRLDLLRDRVRAFDAAAAPVIEQAVASAAPTSSWVSGDSIRFRNGKAKCGPGARRALAPGVGASEDADCFARVEVANAASDAEMFWMHKNRFWLACDSGRVVAMKVVGVEGGRGEPFFEVPPKRTSTVILATAERFLEQGVDPPRPRVLTWDRPRADVQAVIRVE